MLQSVLRPHCDEHFIDLRNAKALLWPRKQSFGIPNFLERNSPGEQEGSCVT